MIEKPALDRVVSTPAEIRILAIDSGVFDELNPTAISISAVDEEIEEMIYERWRRRKRRMERFDEEIEVIYERCRRTMRKMQRFVDRIRCGGRGGNGKMQHTRKGEYGISISIVGVSSSFPSCLSTTKIPAGI